VQHLNISGFDGRGHVIRYALDPENFALHDFALKIGRAPSSDLVIDDSTVSRDHAQISLLEDGFYIRDLGSTNGTYINGVKLSPFEASKICSGDSLTFGKLEFLL
jgi:pSer/pThr/pTyr-binding forkhead associated (FHA) protein